MIDAQSSDGATLSVYTLGIFLLMYVIFKQYFIEISEQDWS